MDISCADRNEFFRGNSNGIAGSWDMSQMARLAKCDFRECPYPALLMWRDGSYCLSTCVSHFRFLEEEQGLFDIPLRLSFLSHTTYHGYRSKVLGTGFTFAEGRAGHGGMPDGWHIEGRELDRAWMARRSNKYQALRSKRQNYLSKCATARRREREGYKTKYGELIEKVAALECGDECVMPVPQDVCSPEWASKVRQALVFYKQTCCFKWSVKVVDGGINVCKVAVWGEHNYYTDNNELKESVRQKTPSEMIDEALSGFAIPKQQPTITVSVHVSDKHQQPQKSRGSVSNYSKSPSRLRMRLGGGSHSSSKTTKGKRKAASRQGKGRRHTTKEKRWTRETIESLERQANEILGEVPIEYKYSSQPSETDADGEEYERGPIISSLREQQNEFEKIFGTATQRQSI